MAQDEGVERSDIALPALPANGQYVYHANECFDWGTVGWALSTLKLNLDIYSFFIFMNSSVRGPFLPAYWPVSECMPSLAPGMQARTIGCARNLGADGVSTALSADQCVCAIFCLQRKVHWSRILTSKLVGKVSMLRHVLITCTNLSF